MGGEKQWWLSVLLKDTSVTARIRTHILLLTPELESGKLDRSATTLHCNITRCKADVGINLLYDFVGGAVTFKKSEIILNLSLNLRKSYSFLNSTLQNI